LKSSSARQAWSRIGREPRSTHKPSAYRRDWAAHRQLGGGCDEWVGRAGTTRCSAWRRTPPARSKRAEDLAALRTLGFRASRPSIASVSRLSLTPAARPAAGRDPVSITRCGKIHEVGSRERPRDHRGSAQPLLQTCRPGRHRFLRSRRPRPPTSSHCVTPEPPGLPHVAYLHPEGRTLGSSAGPRHPNAQGRLAAARAHARPLRARGVAAVEFQAPLAELPGTRVDAEAAGLCALRDAPRGLPALGFIGAPGVSRATREKPAHLRQRRPVENRGINFALAEGYHTAS